MRGQDEKQDGMFSYVAPEQRVPADHPLRKIRTVVDEVLEEMSRDFSRLYADTGRPSIAPERLLRALLLQIFYSIRSERLLVCLESRRLLTGGSPAVVIAREPRSRLPVLLGDQRC
jgi:transposase